MKKLLTAAVIALSVAASNPAFALIPDFNGFIRFIDSFPQDIIHNANYCKRKDFVEAVSKVSKETKKAYDEYKRSGALEKPSEFYKEDCSDIDEIMREITGDGLKKNLARSNAINNEVEKEFYYGSLITVKSCYQAGFISFEGYRVARQRAIYRLKALGETGVEYMGEASIALKGGYHPPSCSEIVEKILK